MKTLITTFDKAAIGISLFCAVHCLLLPVALVTLPALAASSVGNETFHQWLLLAVLPTSIIALTLGCRQHRSFSVLAIGVPGLLILILAALFGHDFLGESGERVATLIGAGLIAFGHFRNHRLCQQHRCHC